MVRHTQHGVGAVLGLRQNREIQSDTCPCRLVHHAVILDEHRSRTQADQSVECYSSEREGLTAFRRRDSLPTCSSNCVKVCSVASTRNVRTRSKILPCHGITNTSPCPPETPALSLLVHETTCGVCSRCPTPILHYLSSGLITLPCTASPQYGHRDLLRGIVLSDSVRLFSH